MTIPQFFFRAQSAGFFLPNFSSSKDYFENTKCIILDGKKVSEEIIDQCKKKFAAENLMTPKLAVILIGDNAASKIYVQNKLKNFTRAGFKSKLITFTNENATNETLLNCICELNKDTEINGILMQLPIPKHLNSEKILQTIDVQKDVDGFSIQNIGLLALNSTKSTISCTPFGIMILLFSYGINPSGKHCVVVGRSAIVGKPMGLLLLNSNATVTYVHSYTKDMHIYTRMADILIVAAGKKHIIRNKDIKEGAIIVDVGIHKNEDGTLTGDVHPEVQKKAFALSPVPGGVGRMTIASLLLNTALCAMIKN